MNWPWLQAKVDQVFSGFGQIRTPALLKSGRCLMGYLTGSSQKIRALTDEGELLTSLRINSQMFAYFKSYRNRSL